MSHEWKRGDGSSTSMYTCDVKNLMNDVASKIPAKWRSVGIQLGLSLDTLHSIQSNNAGKSYTTLDSFEQVFSTWEIQGPSPYTWNTIIEALRTPAVGEVALADELEHKHMKSTQQVGRMASKPVLVPEPYSGDGSSTSMYTCDVKNLMNDVASKIPAMWRSVGIQLGLSLSTLDSIQSNNAGKSRSNLVSFEQVFSTWEKQGPSPYTWNTIIEVLRTPAVGQVALADELEHNHMKSTQQDSKKLYADAMQYGYIERKVVKCLIVGAAGVGKTSIKHLILNMDLPKQRESTGVAEKPAVAVSLSRPVGIARATLKDDGSWHVVHSDEELITMIGELIKCGVTKRQQSHENFETKVADSVGQDEDKLVESAQMQLELKSAAESVSNELITAITYAEGNFQGGEKLLTSKWIHFIDSGGQPEFHDLLPVFVPNASVMLFVFNLSEGLNEKPEIEYYDSKGRIGKSYTSYLTHREILEHCLKVFSAQGEKAPNFMLIGTHNDHHLKKLQVTDLDKILKTCQQGTHVVRFGGQPIAMLDCLSDKDEDKDTVEDIRQQILEVIEGVDSEDTPMAWFGLELALKKASQSVTPKGILSHEQCKQEANLLNYFNTQSGQFDAALEHLVKHNIFLHYQTMLSDVVFCDPQVLLDMVTRIVQHHYMLKHKAVNKKMAPFMDRGYITADILKSISLPCSDDNGIFPLESFLELLKYLKIISPIQKSSVEYLMPALLPIADDLAAKVGEISGKKRLPPLCISFDGGCAPNGVFCSLVTTLLQLDNWKLCIREQNPLCCFRNCVTFEYQEIAIITLVDFFTHFSIYLYIPTHPKISPHIIKDVVHESIREVSHRLHYSHLKFQDAIPCPEHHDDKHVALWHQPTGDAFWKCTFNGLYSKPIPDVYKDWMPSTGDNTPCSPSLPVCNASNVSRPPKPSPDGGQLEANGQLTLKLLTCFPSMVNGEKKTINIIQKTGTSYEKLGMFLLEDENGDIVDSLKEPCHNDPIQITTAVYKKWISGTGRKPVTWQTLVHVLREIDLNRVADDIDSTVNHHANADYSIPDPPSEVTAQPTSSKSIKVSWILPQNISKRGAFEGYELSCSTSNGSTSVLNVGVTTFAEITGLNPYTTYNIYVRTRAAGIYSEYSSPCTATTNEDGHGSSTSSTCNLMNLMNDVASKIPTKWRSVGFQLGLSLSTLDSIQSNNAGKPLTSLVSFEQVFSTWEKQGPSPYTWNTIIEALRKPAVGEVALAGELEVQHMKSVVSNTTPPMTHSSHLSPTDSSTTQKKCTCL